MPVNRKILLAMVAIVLCGCVSSSGNPGLIMMSAGDPAGDEIVYRGVVNGLYSFDSDSTYSEMSKYDDHLMEDEILEYSSRYVVKVGIDREPMIAIISPIVFAKFSDHVILPREWTHDPHAISDDPNVINVGDILEIRIRKGRHYDFAISLIRQCDDPPLEDENRDWNIGCKTYEGFDEYGFAGEVYMFRNF